MSWLSIIPAILGLAQGASAQSDANSLNRRAMNIQEDQYGNFTKPVQGMYLDASKMVMEAVMKSLGMGAYDPSKIMENLRDEHQLLQGRSMGNLAASLRTAGFKDGDTEATRSLTDLGDKFNRDLAFKSTQIEQQAPMALAQALGAALNPAGAGASMGMNAAGQMANAYNQRAAQVDPGDPSGLLMGLMPFLQQIGSGGGGAASPATGGIAQGIAGVLGGLGMAQNDTASGNVLSGLVTKAA